MAKRWERVETCVNKYWRGMAERAAEELLKLTAAKEKIIPRFEKALKLCSQILWFVQKMWLEIIQILMVNNWFNHFPSYINGKEDHRTDEEILLIRNEEFKSTAGVSKRELYHKVTKSCAKILLVFLPPFLSKWKGHIT